ncbi:Gfo/Idh/MocA family oxidoreductase [Agromyces fucosus]|uniref:Gfo/Idh/MocA family oxidoreductase n=1 Tax=Agromyces fucosus TaxID=41985 RepID=A0A4Q2JTH1_9MICO|nr:Gfo/Idh/MocA family oxidoreductase [Agromyces fucosus]RXZ49428.1 Gfo/Idh/MocA family oxidoreductase [Agromyces fucosus]
MFPTTFPEAELFTPGTDAPALRWGLLAPGWIADLFVSAVHEHTDQRFVAVASRSAERARSFSAQHGIAKAYDSYEQLVADPEVDVVYIAAPQSEHLALGLLAIAAGKHVLVEKPMATTADEARVLVAAARSAGILLMEALWSRYLPQTSVVRALVRDGVLGDIRSIAADHGQAIPDYPHHRLHRRELGGGALLDLGIYPVQLDSMVLGAPTSITAIGGLLDTGVDAYSTLVLGHGPSVQSTLTTTLVVRTPSTAVIAGTAARLEMAGSFYMPTTLRLADNDGNALVWNDPTGVTSMAGLSWEATALARFVGQGRTESPVHTLDETVSILETLDEARQQLDDAASGPARPDEVVRGAA